MQIGIKKEEKTVFSLDENYFDESFIPKKSSSTDKNRSIWPLPGGIYNYVETLNKFLVAVKSGANRKSKLIEWYKINFENVKSEKTAEGYIFVPKVWVL